MTKLQFDECPPKKLGIFDHPVYILTNVYDLLLPWGFCASVFEVARACLRAFVTFTRSSRKTTLRGLGLKNGVFVCINCYNIILFLYDIFSDVCVCVCGISKGAGFAPPARRDRPRWNFIDRRPIDGDDESAAAVSLNSILL